MRKIALLLLMAVAITGKEQDLWELLLHTAFTQEKILARLEMQVLLQQTIKKLQTLFAFLVTTVLQRNMCLIILEKTAAWMKCRLGYYVSS